MRGIRIRGMEGAPQKPRGPRWNETVAREDRSILHNAIVGALFAILCVLPAAIWPDRGFLGSGDDRWAYWPPLLVLAVLTVCMLDDHLERSPRDRVLGVLWQGGLFLVMFAVIARILHLNEDPIPVRAGYRAIAGIAPLLFGLNSSRAMVKWAHRSQRIRYDRFGNPYLQ